MTNRVRSWLGWNSSSGIMKPPSHRIYLGAKYRNLKTFTLCFISREGLSYIYQGEDWDDQLSVVLDQVEDESQLMRVKLLKRCFARIMDRIRVIGRDNAVRCNGMKAKTSLVFSTGQRGLVVSSNIKRDQRSEALANQVYFSIPIRNWFQIRGERTGYGRATLVLIQLTKIFVYP